jgi:AraC-like DNA-binding protein
MAEMDGNIHQRIQGWTEALITAGAPARVEVAAERGHPGPGLRSTFDPCWRLVLCREGRARFLVVRAGRPTEIRLAPGELLAIAPRCWVTTAPLAGDSYASLGVVFRRRATRLIVVRCGRARPGAADSAARVGLEALELPHALTAEERGWCDALPTRPAAHGERARRHLGGLLLCRLAELLDTPMALPGGRARETWAAARHLIEERCDQPLGREEIARELGIHPNHLSRLFARFPGGGFHAQVQRLRLERATSLVHDRSLTLAEVAHRCGFGGAHQLIRAFRRAHGVTPRRYRVR